MINKILICPICGGYLNKKDKSYFCNKNHTFDISKFGYTNLLLCQDKNSKNPGDNKEMIQARENFLVKGYYDFLPKEILKIIDSHQLKKTSYLDLGCSEGYFTNIIAERIINENYLATAIGLDISKDAVKIGARKNKDVNYIVASAYKMPIKDNSMNIITSIMAPILDSEVKRILSNDGLLIVVRPGRNHLKSLREFLFSDNVTEIEKATKVKGLKNVETINESTFVKVNGEDILNLVKMTPYYYRITNEILEKISNLKNLDIDFSFNISLYKF